MSEKRSVLIIGYRPALIKACHKIGLRVVNMVDAWDEPHILPECGENEVRLITEDNRKSELMMCTLARNNELSFDAVFTSDELSVVTTTILSNALSTARLINPKMSVAFRDKYYQKELLRGKVLVAQSWLIENINSFYVTEEYPYPVVVKPLSGAGAAHTHIINSRDELVNLIEIHKDNPSLPKSMVIEEFIQGDEMNIDGWVKDGNLQMFAVGKYEQPMREIKNGWLVNAVTLLPESNQEVYEELSPFVKNILSTLGLKNGVFHMEIFYSKEDKKYTFSECAARIPGCFISQAFNDMFEIDLNEVLVRLALGEDITIPQVKGLHYTGWSHLPEVASNLEKLPEKSLLLDLPGVVQVQYDWSPGQKVPDSKEDTTKRTGMILVRGFDETQVQTRIKETIKLFKKLTSTV